MADIDVLPQRGVPVLALVDGTGIASNGSATVAQLAARGMRSICAVDATGVSVSGANVAQLAAAGIRSFCPVDENGASQAGPTADALRRAGIRPLVLLGANGLALTGSATMLTLAQRGLGYFCPVDESGNATTMGAALLLSNNTISTTATIGSTVGALSVVGGSGTYTYSFLSNPGTLFAISGSNLNTAAALTAGDKPITIRAAGGVPTPVDRVFTITAIPPPAIPALTALVGAFPYNGETMTPVTAYSMPMGMGAFAFAGQSATLTPPAGTGPVVLDAVCATGSGIGFNVTAATSSANITGLITVGSGTKRALVVTCVLDNIGTPSSGYNAVWDSGGTNQTMTLLSQQPLGVNGACALVFGLRNPTSGNKTLNLSWTPSSVMYFGAVSFTNVNQTSDATAFPAAGRVIGAATSTLITLNVPSTANDYVVCSTLVPSGSNRTANSGTLLYGSSSGVTHNAGANFDHGGVAGGSSTTITTTINNSLPWVAAAVCVAA